MSILFLQSRFVALSTLLHWF